MTSDFVRVLGSGVYPVETTCCEMAPRTIAGVDFLPDFLEKAMAPMKSIYYQEHTWQDIKDLVRRNPVIVLPIGSVEDHGEYLPIDVDNFLITSISEEAAKRMDSEMIPLPPI